MNRFRLRRILAGSAIFVHIVLWLTFARALGLVPATFVVAVLSGLILGIGLTIRACVPDSTARILKLVSGNPFRSPHQSLQAGAGRLLRATALVSIGGELLIHRHVLLELAAEDFAELTAGIELDRINRSLTVEYRSQAATAGYRDPQRALYAELASARDLGRGAFRIRATRPSPTTFSASSPPDAYAARTEKLTGSLTEKLGGELPTQFEPTAVHSPAVTLRTSEAAFSVRDGRAVIGRAAGCDVPITDPHVSARHAAIELRGDTWLLRDLQSTNGVFIDGLRLHEAVLQPGTQIRLGARADAAKIVFDLQRPAQ